MTTRKTQPKTTKTPANVKTPPAKTSAKPARQKPPSEAKTQTRSKPKAPEVSDTNLYSVSALARKFQCDRATVRTKLDAANVKPVKTASNEKLYDLDECETVLGMSPIDAARLAKTNAEAQLKDLELKRKQGDYASVAEFIEITQQLWGRMHKRLAVQLPARIAGKLHDAHSAAALSAILKKTIEAEFNDLRNDFTRYLGRA